MVDSDGRSAYNTHTDGNAANQSYLAKNPSGQFYDKFDFKNWDPEFELWFLPKAKAIYNLESMYSKIREFFINDEFTDVDIVCENQIFKCHRLVLAASCKYFKAMFSGNFRESNLKEIKLHHVNRATFTEILMFVYKGYCRINDNNVFSLLQASNMFGLTFVESECTRYLIEKSIPAEHALQIFIFACNLKKNVLITRVGQFILEHLEHLSMSAEYLEILFDDLCTLLTNFRSLSVRNEQTLLKAVSCWVCHSERDFERRIVLFDRLRQNAQLFFYSKEKLCSKQFYKTYLENREDVESAAPLFKSIAQYARIMRQVPIHVYVNVPIPSTDDKLQYRTDIFTSKTEECKNEIDWYHHASSMESNYISEMRTVVIQKQLYCLQRRYNSNENPTFSVSASVHLSNSKLLKMPPRRFSYDLLCGDKNSYKIYSYGSHNVSSKPDLLLYVRELDEWMPIPSSHKVKVNCMTYHDDGRLYIFSGPSRNRSIQTYDHRDGKLQLLKHVKMVPFTRTDECCSLRGTICVSGYSGKKCDAIEVFDPRSEKWLDDFKWIIALQEPEKNSRHRLVSYNNELWMFNSAKPINENRKDIKKIYLRTYNIFQRRCFLWQSLDDTIFKNVSSYGNGSCYANILDVAII